MGDAGGHISLALAIAQAMPEHEFLFVGGGKVTQLTDAGYSVAEVSTFETRYVGDRVDILATGVRGVASLLSTGRVAAKATDIVKDFRPDLALTSYEYSVPLAARRLGIPVASVTNQHSLSKCDYVCPRGQMLSRLAFGIPLRLFFSNADFFIVSAFYGLKPLAPSNTWALPPVLRKPVLDVTPSERDHRVVYHTSPTFRAIERLLENFPGKSIIYGLGEKPSRGNLEYKAHSVHGFLEDIASARYVITNGGHTVISEALHYGKPVLAFPINFAYEQFFNGYMLRSLRYGDFCLSQTPDVSVVRGFEQRLDEFRANISGRAFYGNDQVVARIRALL